MSMCVTQGLSSVHLKQNYKAKPRTKLGGPFLRVFPVQCTNNVQTHALKVGCLQKLVLKNKSISQTMIDIFGKMSKVL